MEYQDRRVHFFALDAWDGNIGQVGGFITASGIDYPVLTRASTVTSSYGVRHDSVFVVRGDGTVGYIDARGFEAGSVRVAIDSALEALPVPVTAASFGGVKALFGTP